MYNIILVEDDPIQREILKRIVISAYEFVKIYEADSEITALEIIRKNDINMFLIDIQLKKSSGLDLAMKIRNIPKYEFRQIIFLTTHMEYITQAFKQTHCYDFILKPYDKESVQTMLKKIILNETKNLVNKSDNRNKTEEKEIVITLKNGILVGIKARNIFFIEVIGKNCEINTANGIYVSSNTSLKKLIKLIDCEYIIQSHRAFAININCVCKIEKLDVKLSEVYFDKYSKTALLGYKFKNDVISKFKEGKKMVC